MTSVFQGHKDTVNHLRFSPDGRWIISAGQDGVAKVWPYVFKITPYNSTHPMLLLYIFPNQYSCNSQLCETLDLWRCFNIHIHYSLYGANFALVNFSPIKMSSNLSFYWFLLVY